MAGSSAGSYLSFSTAMIVCLVTPGLSAGSSCLDLLFFRRSLIVCFILFCLRHGRSLSPDRDPVLRSQVHAVSFVNTVEIQEFFILLQGGVDPVHPLPCLVPEASGAKTKCCYESLLFCWCGSNFTVYSARYSVDLIVSYALSQTTFFHAFPACEGPLHTRLTAYGPGDSIRKNGQTSSSGSSKRRTVTAALSPSGSAPARTSLYP